MSDYGSIEDIEKRHTEAGMMTTHLDGAAKIWLQHYMNDVASLLYELSTRSSQWISAEDRLPEKDGYYLTYGCIPKYRIPNHTNLTKFKDGAWLWDVMEIPYEGVTHWQPIPEPPK